MPKRYLAVLATALLVPACAGMDPDWETDALDPEKYPRVVRYSELDLSAPAQAVAECARDRMIEIGEEGSTGLAFSTIPFIEQVNGHLTLVGRTPFGHPFGVQFDETGEATHAVVYISIEYQQRRRLNEIIGRILRVCG